MKIDDIRAFVAVIRCQSISLAADTLQLTQPAITRRVQNFEEALGAELLDRNTKPLRPTPIGLRVYEQCRAVLREMDVLSELVAQDALPSGALRIGVPQSISDAVLLSSLNALRGIYPELKAQVSTGWGTHLLSRVEHGELDAAVVLFPAGKVFPDGVSNRSLGKMSLVVVAPKGSMSKRNYRLADCYQQGWILNPDGCGFRAGLQRMLASQGLNFQINMETFGTELQLGLVANGQGLGLVPKPLLDNSKYKNELDIVPISDFKPLLDLWLIHSRFLGNLQLSIDYFAELVAQRLSGELQPYREKAG
jgi:DNA-binding transcriptional LysR family regulator